MLQLVTHLIHIIATCVSLGGLFYSRMVLWPNLKYIPEEARDAYLAKMVRRYGIIKWIGIILITFTGVVQWLDIYPQVEHKMAYLFAFVFKMMGAGGLLTITSMLALPLEAFTPIRKRRAFWSAMNLFFGLMILIGAALMRSIRNGDWPV
jgi:uncharacterized membrane protein